MLTPAFSLTQDEVFVYIEIRTPYVKISDVEFFIHGQEFKFYVRPYFLRLNLPGEIVEDGRESASYDVEKGVFNVKVPKMQTGEHFEDLEMLTKLLEVPAKERVQKPCIEVLNDDTADTVQGEQIEENEEEEEDEMEWYWEQHVETPCDDLLLTFPGYGFNNKTTGLFVNRQEELYEVADIREPETLTLKDRRKLRMESESTCFDPEYYLADLYDDSQIKCALNFETPWKKVNATESSSPASFSEEEKLKLKNLPNKEYLLDDAEEVKLLFGLVDLIFAYAYNYRITEGDSNVESAWTINKLSSTLSWFESFSSVQEVLDAACRRSLCFPLYRHWQLTRTVLKDTKDIFSKGRLQLVRCLLEIHSLFSQSEPRYILNDLYITDYCVWTQKVSKKKLKWLSNVLLKADVMKADIGLELAEFEEAARLVQLEQNMVEDGNISQVQEQLAQCSLEDADEDTDSSDEDSSSDEETSEDSSESSEEEEDAPKDQDSSTEPSLPSEEKS